MTGGGESEKGRGGRLYLSAGFRARLDRLPWQECHCARPLAIANGAEDTCSSDDESACAADVLPIRRGRPCKAHAHLGIAVVALNKCKILCTDSLEQDGE